MSMLNTMASATAIGSNLEYKIPLARPDVGEAELQAVAQVFQSGTLTEGPVVAKFQEEAAKYVGARYAVATTSCTIALELGLRAIGVGAGDEVILPAFTHPATCCAVLSLGASPVLVDIDPETFNIDPVTAKQAVTSNTKCLIPVSLFGNPVDYRSLKELSEAHGLSIVEDAACSLGAEVNGRRVGTQADITCFSLHPRKIITSGEGGILVTNSQEVAEKALSYKRFGQAWKDGKIVFTSPGTSYKFNDISAAIALVQIGRVEKFIAERISQAQVYSRLLEEEAKVSTPKVRKGTRHTFQSYCIMLNRDGVRDKVIKVMASLGVEVQIGSYALHLQPAFSRYGHDGLRNSEKAFNNSLVLPLYSSLEYEQQVYVCQAFSKVLTSG